MASYLSARAFRTSLVKLCPAKPTASAGAASAAVPASKKTKPKVEASPKRKEAAPARQGSGITKNVPISPTLRNFMGVPEASRSEAVKVIWAHIKLNNLQNPSNKKEIICDAKLKQVLGKERVEFLEISKLLSLHFPKSG